MRAIRAASAFDGERFLPGATVVMEGDRIVGVETRGSEVPAGTEVAEYSGTVLPGLIDCPHPPDRRRIVRWAGTGWFDERRRAGPRVVASRPPVTTPDGHCHFLGGAVRGLLDADLRNAVAERVTRGVDVVK